jgi:hypothetical protein
MRRSALPANLVMRCEPRQARVRQVEIAPSTSVLAPLIRGEPDMVGLLLGFRELLRFFGWISRTFVSYSSLSELCFPWESAICLMQVESVGWCGNIIFLFTRRDVFQEGSARHVDVASSRGSTRHVIPAYRYRGSTRHVVAAYQGTIPSPIQSVPVPSERFFSSPIHRIRHAHALTHLRPGPVA